MIINVPVARPQEQPRISLFFFGSEIRLLPCILWPYLVPDTNHIIHVINTNLLITAQIYCSAPHSSPPPPSCLPSLPLQTRPPPPRSHDFWARFVWRTMAAAGSGGQAAASSPGMFEVFVGKEDFKFSSSHFVAFDGFRERLHGHNYTCTVRLKGEVRQISAISCWLRILSDCLRTYYFYVIVFFYFLTHFSSRRVERRFFCEHTYLGTLFLGMGDPKEVSCIQFFSRPWIFVFGAPPPPHQTPFPSPPHPSLSPTADEPVSIQ